MRKLLFCSVLVLAFVSGSCSLEDILSDGRVEITTPEDGQKVNNRSISVKGRFTYTGERDDEAEEDSSAEPFSVEILVNSDIQETVTSTSDIVRFNSAVTLEEGDNYISVIGYYLEDEVRDKEITITCDTTPPMVVFTTYYNDPITVETLEITGTVKLEDLNTIQYKTIYTDRSDPENPTTAETEYTDLSYDKSEDFLGSWSISEENNSTTMYSDENSVGDLLTVTIRAVDDLGNTGTNTKEYELFKPGTN